MTGPSLARIGLAAGIGMEPTKFHYYGSVERAQAAATDFRMFFGTVRVDVRDARGAWVRVPRGPLQRVARAVDLRRLAAVVRRRDEPAAGWLELAAKHIEELGPDRTIAVDQEMVELCEREGIVLMTAVTLAAAR